MEVRVGLKQSRGVRSANEMYIDNEYLGLDNVQLWSGEVEYSMTV